MTFDPFGDFQTRGYLRNLVNEKDPDIVRRLEHYYLTALTTSSTIPARDLLDDYLKPFIKSAVAPNRLAAGVAAAPGLDGNADNTVLGKTSEPALQARYEQQELKRKQAQE